MPTIPSIKDICQQIHDEVSAIKFLTDRRILKKPKETVCYVCGYVGCRVKSKATPKSLKCNRKDCQKGQSLLRGTIFAGSKMPLHQLLHLSAFWLFESPNAVVRTQLHCAGKFISDFYSLFRKMVAKIVFLDDGGSYAVRMDEDMAVSIWRRRNATNLWNAFLDTLKRIGYFPEIGFFDATGSVGPQDAGVDAYNGYSPGKNSEYDPQHYIGQSHQATAEVAPAATAVPVIMCGEVQQQQEQLPEMKTKQVKQEKRPRKSTIEKRLHSVSTYGEMGGLQPEQRIGSRKRPKTIQSIPSFLDICCQIPSEDKAIEFLMSKGIFANPKHITCSHCGYVGFRAKGRKTPKSIKCNRCSKSASLMKGTFFEGIKTPLQQILYMALFWLKLSPARTIITQLRCSSATVSNVSEKFRKLVSLHMEEELPRERNDDTSMIPQFQLAENAARLKRHIPRFARKDVLDEHVCAAMWREMNSNNLWEAFIVALRTVNNKDAGASTAKFIDEPRIDEKSGKVCCKCHSRVKKTQQLILPNSQAVEMEQTAPG